MRTFALAYPDEQIVRRSAAQLPWRQTMVVLDKLKDQEQRLWYTAQSLENGWSRGRSRHANP
jgi:predicted nuclease of restriction endonuclease-like (RecB) superfamily